MKKPLLLRKIISVVTFLFIIGCATTMEEKTFLIKPEATKYKETSLYKDVVEVCNTLTAKSDKIKLQYIGKSHEGRPIPLLIVNTGATFTPEEAAKNNCLVLFIMCNIHAGEVEGKEAMMIILRDLINKKIKPSEKLVMVIMPLFNIDGNERINPNNRVFNSENLGGQIGPESGVGTRYTAEGYNLNRDYMKAESNEMKIMLREVYYKWMPHVTVDCHTTDGSFHGFELTYGTAMNYTGDATVIDYVRTKMLPYLTKNLYNRTGLHTFFYGNFVSNEDPKSGWRTYSHLPRYGSNYRGLTNRMDILLETYSYLTFKDRISTIKEFLLEIIDYCQDNADEIIRTVDQANKDTINKIKGISSGDLVAVSYDPNPVPYDEEVDIVLRGFRVKTEFDSNTGFTRYLNFERDMSTKKIKTKFYGWFKASKLVRRPSAYIIPKEHKKVFDALKIHNVKMFEIERSSKIEVEAYSISDISKVASPDYGDSKNYKETRFTVQNGTKIMTFKPGDVVVPLGQAQGNLIIYLLEPESDDGLAAWNYFDLKVGDEYPVYRVLTSIETSAAK